MLVVGGHVGKHLCQSCQHPSVATRPEILVAEVGLMGWIDILAVAEIEVRLLVPHQVVGILVVCIQLVEILLVAGHLIQLGIYRHHHIQGVSPPPIVSGGVLYLIVHHLNGAGNLVCVGIHAIHVEVGLETNLPVAELHVLHRLAILLVEPF